MKNWEIDKHFQNEKDGSKIPAHFIMSLNRGRTEECTYHFDSPVSVADVDHVEFTN